MPTREPPDGPDAGPASSEQTMPQDPAGSEVRPSEVRPSEARPSEARLTGALATDYGDDVSETESSAVSARFAPGTDRQLRRAGLILIVVLAMGFVAVRIDRLFHDRSLDAAARHALTAAHPVDVVEARPVTASQQLVLPAQTAAWHESTIYGRVDGYVGQWFVDIGDKVKDGQVLCLIETPELDAQLAAARAQLQASAAQVLVREAEAEFAQTTYVRWRDSPQGVVSEQERDEKKADYDSAVARLKAAQAQVAMDQESVNHYLAMSAFKRVTAPFSGVITERDIDIGDLVTAGSTSSTTLLYKMSQDNPMRVFVAVPQSAAAELMRPGVPARIEVGDGTETPAYLGKITRTATAINLQARTMRVEIDVPNTSHQLVPGMYLKVAFELPPRGLVQVPAAAVMFRASGPEVARVDSSGRIHFQSVTIARDDGAVVDLGSGASPGDLLALNLSDQIADGERVSIGERAVRAAGAREIASSEP